MAEEFNPGCERPAIEKPITEEVALAPSNGESGRESKHNMIKVGKPAPDFSAPAFIDGKFSKVKLSDYKGQWVVLCFYPGDFTFV